MAASAFAAVSQINGFHGDHDENQEAESEGQIEQGSLDRDKHSSQDRPAAQDELTAAESAQAEQQTAQHEQHQAQSPEADTDAGADTAENDAKTAQHGYKDAQIGAETSQNDTTASSQTSEALDARSPPQTETSLTALRLNTDASQSQAQAIPESASGHDQDPAAESPAAPASQGSDFAGSPAGSHTFDAELHEGIAALVQTPADTDTADQQPSHAATSTEVDAAGMSIQGLTTPPSSPESMSNQQGPEAAQEAAAAGVDQAPVYALGSDEEDDLTVVSSKDQAREAQVSFCLQTIAAAEC